MDAPAIVALQSLLAEPAPELLDVGLSAGDVLASTRPASAHGGASSCGRAAPLRSDATESDDAPAAAPPDVPVGYLLPVGGDDVVHVAELAVAPDARREGRASALLRALGDALPPDARITIAVAPSNRAARACYESLEFDIAARRGGYFESGPAVVYERRAGAERDGEG